MTDGQTYKVRDRPNQEMHIHLKIIQGTDYWVLREYKLHSRVSLEGKSCCSMVLLDGKSCGERAAERGSPPPCNVSFIADSISDGLQCYLHRLPVANC